MSEFNDPTPTIKQMARTILHLCRSGCQVFVASHSLFLMRELDIFLRTDEFKEAASQFIGLHRGEDGVDVRQGETIDDIGQIDALQEELSQSDRYLEMEAQADDARGPISSAAVCLCGE
jgi:hypothetical protein